MKSHKLLALFTAVLLLFGSVGMAESLSGDYLGKPMPDFTVRTIDGGTFTLSEALKEKDMVLINLWASWCGPCEMEFPYLQEAYERYQDRVAVIALSTEPTDTDEVLSAYAASHGMTFPVAGEGNTSLSAYLHVMYIPSSVVGDRFGNVALAESGTQPSAEAFAALFERFLGDDYTETQVQYGFPKPDAAVRGVSDEELSAAAGLPLTGPEDPSVYPFLPGEADGRTCIYAANTGYDSTGARADALVTAGEGDALAFDLKVSSEETFDALSISVNGTRVKKFSGEKDWMCYAVPLTEGENQISFAFTKDENCAAGADTAYLASLRLLSGEEAKAALDANPVYPFAAETRLEAVGAREIVFGEGTEGSPDLYFGMPASVYILNGTEGEVKASLGPDADPDDTVLYDLMEGSAVGAETLLSPVPVSVSSPFGAWILLDIRTGEYLKMLIAFPDEESADLVEADLMEYGLSTGYTYLDGGERSAPSAEAPAAAVPQEVPSEGEWTVLFLDQNGDAVPGCIVNFCSDTMCTPVVADENGVARFTGAPFAYHLQVLRVPDGYSFDTAQEYYTEVSGGSMTLLVTKD